MCIHFSLQLQSQEGDRETDRVVCAGFVQVLDISAKGGHVRFKI